MSKVRCAIYTRKSSEEGLEQDFNSLDAQREACAAYIQSQASEGWSLLDRTYDDGGLSGGTMKRPALQRLLRDMRDGRIDIVVVYKVDRLTRSLLDFAKLVETMDTAKVSFVSVTQSFNTTTSMGRLTLNMLLSFAQFEREVTAERIRDKIAASKAKGMWMGGIPPLGYAPDGRTLKIVPGHAAIVRDIFERYCKLGTVRLVYEQLASDGVQVPTRTLTTGRTIGGSAFTRNQIYRMLSNPIYIGEIHHGGKGYKGKHDAIIDRETWTGVQAQLGENRQGDQRAATITSPSLLAGKVFDAEGEPLVASHACKGKVRYRYYVSRSLQHRAGDTDQRDSGTKRDGWRIPAKELEGAVAQRLGDALADPLELAATLDITIEAGTLDGLAHRCAVLAKQVRAKRAATLRPMIERVTIHPDKLAIILLPSGMSEALGQPVQSEHPISIVAKVRLTKAGHAVRLITSDGRSAAPQVNDQLVSLLRQAKTWWQQLRAEAITVTELARRQDITESYITRILRLNFLAPDIVESILSGTHPARLDAARLKSSDFPTDWKDQREVFGFAAG